MYIYIYLYIYKKLSPEWKNFHEQKVFLFRFYILCENFSKIGPIIKKIPKFWDDPLNSFESHLPEGGQSCPLEACPAPIEIEEGVEGLKAPPEEHLPQTEPQEHWMQWRWAWRQEKSDEELQAGPVNERENPSMSLWRNIRVAINFAGMLLVSNNSICCYLRR